jgi:hypothetical protein
MKTVEPLHGSLATAGITPKRDACLPFRPAHSQFCARQKLQAAHAIPSAAFTRFACKSVGFFQPILRGEQISGAWVLLHASLSIYRMHLPSTA